MYKNIHILAILVLILASCGKDENLCDLQICASIQPEVIVRSTAEPEALLADHAVLEVWSGNIREARQELGITPGTQNITFNNVKLAAGVDYDVFIWVDNKGYYDTEDLRSVRLNSKKSYDGKTPQFDAFYACSQMHSSQYSEVCQITLMRPFAKLNFSAEVDQSVKSVQIGFSAPTTLQLKTGKVSDFKKIKYTIEPVASKVTAYDFVFADEDTAQMEYSFQIGKAETKTTFVPSARNVVTNIILNNINN